MVISKGRKKIKIAVTIGVIFVIALAITVVLLGRFANRIIKAELEKRLGRDFSVEKIDVGWDHITATGISLRTASGKAVFKVEDLLIKADFMGILRRKHIISSVLFKNPYVLVEVDNKGNIVSPILPVEPKREEPAKGPKSQGEARAARSSTPIIVKNIEIAGGSLDYLDGKPSPKPVLTRVRNINVTLKDISVPFSDAFSTYAMSAEIPGRGSNGMVKSKGKIQFKTKDMECEGEIRSLDITGFKPYFPKDTEINVTKGIVDLDITAKVISRKIHAPGKLTLKHLELQSGDGGGRKFMGVPLKLVVAFLKKSNDEIPVDFVLQGDLDNPGFKIKETFVREISLAIAGKLGFSVEDIAESLLGAGVKGGGDIGSGVGGIGESLKELLSK